MEQEEGTYIQDLQEKYKVEMLIRRAEALIQQSKNCLSEIYDEHEDVQRLMHNLEMARQEAEILLSKFLEGNIAKTPRRRKTT